jgi:hypothetical protein
MLWAPATFFFRFLNEKGLGNFCRIIGGSRTITYLGWAEIHPYWLIFNAFSKAYGDDLFSIDHVGRTSMQFSIFCLFMKVYD